MYVDEIAVPAGWPTQVRPPGAEGHVRSAVGWLLEQCPPNYRAHPVLRSRPLVLVWLAGLQVESQQAANVAARGAARAELRDVLGDPRAVEALLRVLDAEQARLLGIERAVRLIGEALAQRSDDDGPSGT